MSTHRLTFSFLTLGLLALTLIFGSTACRKDLLSDENLPLTETVAGERQNNTIVDIALSNPDFSILVAAVVKTNLAGFLSAAGRDATVFAPNNAAFSALPAPFNSAQGIAAITDVKQINQLRQIIRYHVALGARTAAQLPNGSYNTYKNAVTPNDNWLYVSRDAAGSVFVNGNSKVIAADIQASNGVIHVVDKVLLFPTQDIAQIAIANGSFTALVAAVQKTGLTNALMAPTNNFTVFAPTDAAFANLPAPLNTAANIRNIQDPATIDLLRNVLQYHLIGARVFSADLREGISAPTLLSGQNVSITLAGGPKVQGTGNASGSNIVATDILARNGVIHVIDQVLLP